MSDKTFAIADLHGRFDLLEKALAAIEAYAPEGGKIVFLGDYVDRGPFSRDIIERLMGGPDDPSRWRWVCLKGNHEDMMVDHCRTNRGLGTWMQNGGGATLISYGHPETGKIDVSVVPESHLRWVDKLPNYHDDEHRVFVHAGVVPNMPLEEQPELVLIWMLYQDNDPGGHGKRFVVHGHHQFEDGPKLHLGRVDLDTFAWATGRLVVGVFDDAIAGRPVDFIEVLGEPNQHFRLRAAE